MRRHLIGASRFLIGTLLFPAAWPIYAQTAGEMLQYCRDVVSARKTADKQIYLPLTFESGQCWGAFAVIDRMVVLFDPAVPTRKVFPVCRPDGTTRQQNVAIFVNYVEKNPHLWHEDFLTLAIDSQVAAYPCKQGKATR